MEGGPSGLIATAPPWLHPLHRANAMEGVRCSTALTMSLQLQLSHRANAMEGADRLFRFRMHFDGFN